MALISNHTEVYRFVDAEGDAGEWHFTPRMREGDRQAALKRAYDMGLAMSGQEITADKISMKEERYQKAICDIRTVSWEGPFFVVKLPEGKTFKSKSGRVFKNGDVLPSDAPGRSEFIAMFPETIITGAAEFLEALEQRSPEDQARFPTDDPGVDGAAEPAEVGPDLGEPVEPAAA